MAVTSVVQFRVWPTAAAVAMMATTAIALARPTPIDVSGMHMHPTIQRHIATSVVHRPIPIAASQVIAPRSDDRSDDRLLRRIDQIRDESCPMVMRDRPDFDGAILAGIIEQRQDQCRRA